MGNDQSSVSSGDRKSGLDQIVVVNKGANDDEVVNTDSNAQPSGDKSEIDELADIPRFLPLLRDSVSGLSSNSVSNSKSAVAALNPPNIDNLDSRAIMHYCIRYQEHLKSCAEAIAFDQTNLCSQMKDLDFALKQFNDILMERQKKYSRFAEQLNKIQEMTHVLIRVRSNADGLVQTMEKLNSLLPDNEQLEPFRFLPEVD